MASLELQNINKIYNGSVHAVKDVNLDISDKEFLVLVGPSGCGKSTLLRMIAGLEEISSGTMKIGERVVNDISPKDRDIAMVFQNYALYPHMSVYENMAFGLKLRKMPSQEVNDRVREAAELLELSDLLDRKPKALSGGQRQRVALGRAIVRKPQVFLFDEPLSNLDAKLRVQMRLEIKKLHQRLQTTMIYVTHDQVEAMTMGDRIVVMKEGVVQQVDTPLNLYGYPSNKFVAGFIGSPAMNFFNGIITTEYSKFYFKTTEFKIPIDEKALDKNFENNEAKEVILGIRPEHLIVSESTTLFKAKLEVIEPLGSEIYLHLKTELHRFAIRTSKITDFAVGQDIYLACETKNMHFFDTETENRFN